MYVQVLQQIARELSDDAQNLCRLACTCKVFRAIADSDLAWEPLCSTDRVEYGILVNRKHSRRTQEQLQNHGGSDPSRTSSCNPSAKQIYAAWYGARPGPGGHGLRHAAAAGNRTRYNNRIDEDCVSVFTCG